METWKSVNLQYFLGTVVGMSGYQDSDTGLFPLPLVLMDIAIWSKCGYLFFLQKSICAEVENV
jgi:hypothetical protein